MAQEPEVAKKNPLGAAGENVRRNVARLRSKKELGYAELSRNLGNLGRAIPPLGLARIEKGERRVDADDLVALARALSTTVETLLAPEGNDVVEKRVIEFQAEVSAAYEASNESVQQYLHSVVCVLGELRDRPDTVSVLAYLDGEGPKSVEDYIPWMIRRLSTPKADSTWIGIEVGHESDVKQLRELAAALITHITSGPVSVYDPDAKGDASRTLEIDG